LLAERFPSLLILHSNGGKSNFLFSVIFAAYIQYFDIAPPSFAMQVSGGICRAGLIAMPAFGYDI